MTSVMSSRLYTPVQPLLTVSCLNPCVLQKGQLGLPEEWVCLGSWPANAELDGTPGSGRPAHLSPTPKFQVSSWNQCHPSASSAELDSPGQPRSSAGTLTPLGVFSAELSLRVLSVVAIYYCHGHHMLDLSVSKTIKEIHLLLTYDRCKTDCFLGSELGAKCGSSKSLFKASSFPRLPGAGLAQGRPGKYILRLLWSAPHADARDRLPSPWRAHPPASLGCSRWHRAQVLQLSAALGASVSASHRTASGGRASTLYPGLHTQTRDCGLRAAQP